ncbi:TolC family protein [Pontibacter sp. MBLB2868]|uniref:TolC family protein n=1 Tax=Pontibacter sp. MBLB2868 TaxID=3451555 RepID=UPI003F750662
MKLCLKFYAMMLLLGVLLVQVSAASAQTRLEGYIKEGLKSNLYLQQKQNELKKAGLSFQTANSYFLPAVNFSGGYTNGEGGRTISLPVGDMLNPVYATLNKLTEGRPFPQVENMEQSFFPSDLYDAPVRATLPLLNKDLRYASKIQHEQIAFHELGLRMSERELVKEIKTAYYGYWSALEVVKIYESAMQLVTQNVQVNESLLQNGKGLPAMLLRAQSELEKVKAQLQESRTAAENAQRYFNLLLNRDQLTHIEADTVLEPALQLAIQALISADNQEREELAMLKAGMRMQEEVHGRDQDYWVPKVGAFLDLGVQAQQLKFNGQSDYYLVGLTVDMPVFNGFRHLYKSRSSMLDLANARLQLEYKRQQVQLAVDVSRRNLQTSYHNYLASQQRLKAAESYFHLITRGYREGINSMIEFIDGRTQLTEARLQVTLDGFKVLSAFAQLERETASYVFPQEEVQSPIK